MAIPRFNDFMLPLLEMLEDEKEYDLSDLHEKLAQYFNLSEEEKEVCFRVENKKSIKTG